MGRYPAIRFRHSTFPFDRALVFAVLNLTPDSFSDGGQLASAEAAVAAGLRAAQLGADALDVGGESTRPGARPVPAAEEIERVVEVVRALATRAPVPVSIDTTKAEVAAAALAAGAEIVNDISGGSFDPGIVDVVAGAGAAYVCGHVRGRTLDEVHAAEMAPPTFDEVVAELGRALDRLPPAVRERAFVDPCLGFGKRTRQNLELIRRAGDIGAALGRPVLIGPSRKRFLGELTGRPVADRDDATVGAALAAVAAGAAAVRVHDVKRTRDALTVWEQVMAGEGGR